jgi:N-acetylmuramic acid 6-phosphate etherase
MDTSLKLVHSLNSISTEGRNPDTLDIDLLDSLGVVKKINHEDKKVANVVGKLLPNIAQAVDLIVASFFTRWSTDLYWRGN